jgi:hypothetical protein
MKGSCLFCRYEFSFVCVKKVVKRDILFLFECTQNKQQTKC